MKRDRTFYLVIVIFALLFIFYPVKLGTVIEPQSDCETCPVFSQQEKTNIQLGEPVVFIDYQENYGVDVYYSNLLVNGSAGAFVGMVLMYLYRIVGPPISLRKRRRKK